MTDSGRKGAPSPYRRRRWWHRRNKLGLRNGQLVLLILAAVAVGLFVTVLTAGMGLR